MNRSRQGIARIYLACGTLALFSLPANLLSSASAQWEADLLFVDDNAPPGGDGLTWATAFNDLQEALQTAYDVNQSDIDPDPWLTISEIWIAEGTYYPSSPPDSFILLDGVALLGGFAGNETALGQRDPSQHPTILSGITSGGTTGSLVFGGVSSFSNEFTGDGTTLDGLTLTNAVVGLSLAGSGAPVIHNCIFEDNRHGIFVFAGSPVFTSCIIRDNHMTVTYPYDYPSGGAGTFIEDGNVTFSDCLFESNIARDDSFDPNGYGYGGALLTHDSPNGFSTINLNRCVFLDNQAGYTGGAVCVRSGFEVSMMDCDFRGNRAFEGGALATIGSSHITITNSLFSGNGGPTFRAGAILNLDDGDLDMRNCTIAGNKATWVDSSGGPGDPYARFESTGGHVGGIYSSGNLNMANCAVWGNEQHWTNDGLFHAQLHIPDYETNTVSLYHNCVENWDETIMGLSYVEGYGNIGGDSDTTLLFRNPKGADGMAGTMDDDLRLLGHALAVDTGKNDMVPVEVVTDLGGLPRFYNTVIDMGAYEFQPVPPEPPDKGGRTGETDTGEGSSDPKVILKTPQ